MKKITGCLDGIRVIDVSRLYRGPFCTMILAENGADVIAIEDKRFEIDNLFIESLCRNKRHINLNLKKPKGIEVFFRLVKDADVFMVIDIENSEGKRFKSNVFPIKFSKNPSRIKKRPVKFGENTVEILKSLGYSEDELNEII